MLSFLIIVLLLVCATNCTARIKEHGKVDFIAGASAAVCVGAVIGLLIYRFL